MLRAQVKATAQRLLPRLTRGQMVWRGPATARRVALTFDDGPGELTAAYLDALASVDAPATFFLMGFYVERQPEALGAYLRGGHQIAGHGYFHERFTRLGVRGLGDELTRMERALGTLPWGRWVRPPHGTLGLADSGVMLARGYTVAMWSFDSLDYDGADAATLVERCRPDRVAPGEVMLFHEHNQATIDALPEIVRGLRADGYELVTMADLLAP